MAFFHVLHEDRAGQRSANDHVLETELRQLGIGSGFDERGLRVGEFQSSALVLLDRDHTVRQELLGALHLSLGNVHARQGHLDIGVRLIGDVSHVPRIDLRQKGPRLYLVANIDMETKDLA